MPTSDRIERLCQVVDQLLRQQQDLEEQRCGFVHLYGVAQLCGLLALRRGYKPTDLFIAAGMLHDIATYETNDPTDHAVRSAQEAERILGEVGGFSGSEIEAVREMILSHSDKKGFHHPYNELLKDADVLQHHLYQPSLESATESSHRLLPVMAELGCDPDHPL